jgi:hypothetical protein
MSGKPDADTERAYFRGTLALVLGFTLFRLLLAAWLPLISDEAYGVVVSRLPTLSYFDHPPLAFGFARAAALLFGTEAAFVVRIPHVLMGTLSALLIYAVTRRAFGVAAGFWATAAFSVAPFFLAAAGTFVVPDGPLNLFALGALWLALPAMLGDEPMTPRRWLLAGLSLGLALLSKYTAVSFVGSAFLVLLSTPHGRRCLAGPGPWAAALLALACATPVIWWNWQNDWVSFTFQAGRASSAGLHPSNFLAIQLGQAAYLLPWTWAAVLVLTARGLVKGGRERVFAIFAAPPVAIFGVVGLFTQEPLAHWAMPGFLFGFPLLGAWCATRWRGRLQPFANAVAAISMTLALLLGAAVAVQTSSAGVTRALGLSNVRDFDWTFLSWSALRDDFEARGILNDPRAFLFTANWNSSGKAAHALGPEMPVAIPLVYPRQFGLVPDSRADARTQGYYVEPAWPGEEATAIAFMRETAQSRFDINGEPWVVEQKRGGTTAFLIVILPISTRSDSIE